MRVVAGVFWGCLGVLAYTWLGYPLLVWFWAGMRQAASDGRYMLDRAERRRGAPPVWPSVTICIAAHNEAGRLGAQLASLQQLDYPDWQAIYVLDGCTDQTEQELAHQLRVQVMAQPRQGKAAALLAARARAQGEVLVFTDAGTRLAPDALRRLARHFVDPQVGVVCGAVTLEVPPGAPRLERTYWRWESALRWLEARLGVTVTASGALIAVRRRCFPALPAQTLVEDLEIPMRARAAGYRILYDPEARACDEAAGSLAAESRRRQRLALGGWRALARLWALPLGGRTRWALVSHKILRWLTPWLSLLLLAANLALLGQPAFWIPAGLEGMALMLMIASGLRAKPADSWLAYFWVMNCALVRGAWRTRNQDRQGTWEQAR